MLEKAVGKFAEHERHTPSVTISRVKSEPRSTRKLVTKPERRRGQARQDERNDRLVDDAVFGKEAGAITRKTEKRRLTKRDNAGIAKDQVERERE